MNWWEKDVLKTLYDHFKEHPEQYLEPGTYNKKEYPILDYFEELKRKEEQMNETPNQVVNSNDTGEDVPEFLRRVVNPTEDEKSKTEESKKEDKDLEWRGDDIPDTD